MNYSEKLKDPRWQKKRLEIFNRDEWTCQLCGDKDSTLHVHHLTYKPNTEPWDYPNGYLTTLCENCHEYESTYRQEAEKMLLDRLKYHEYYADDLIDLSIAFNNFCVYPKNVIVNILKYLSINENLYAFVCDNYFESLKKDKK